MILGSLSNSTIESLQHLQDRAGTMTHTSRIKEDWIPNFLAVKQLTTCDRAVMTYKIFNKLCLEDLWNKFHLRSHYSRYNTRLCRNIQVPKYNLEHMCQTQACGPNLARNVIMIGLRDHIKCALELALGLSYISYFKVNFSCVCSIKTCLFQILCLSKIEICFHTKRLSIAYQLQLIFNKY